MALLTVTETKNWLSKGGLIIDLRSIDAFMDGFIPGSVYMPYSDNFYSVLDTLCETEDAIILVSENPAQQAEIEKLKEYKATLINSAVTGKIKIA